MYIIPWYHLILAYLLFIYFTLIPVFIGFPVKNEFVFFSTLAFTAPMLFIGRYRTIYCIIISLIQAIFALFFLLHYCIFDDGPGSYTFLIMLQTNGAESSEFISQYFNWMDLLWSLLFFIPPAILIWLIRKLPEIPKGLAIPKIIVALILIYFNIHQHAYNLNLTGFFIQNYADAGKEMQSFNQLKGLIKNRSIDLSSVKSKNPTSLKELHVIILGESLSRNHMSLYGYERKTNPLLEQKKQELHCFSDVLSPHCYTTGSMQKMLLDNSWGGKNKFMNKETIMDICNAAGYQTWWISNQPAIGMHETIVTSLASLCDSTIMVNYSGISNTNQSYDKVVLNPTAKVVHQFNTNQIGNKQVIFIHLMGSHLKYNMRYPSEYAKFNSDNSLDSKHPFLTQDELKLRNEYDNSVLYNDWIIHQILSMVDSANSYSSITYLSDHSEEVGDEKNFFGHNETNPTKGTFEIPFVVWLSPEFKKENTTLSDSISNYINRPYQTDDLIHSISNLYQIDWKNYQSQKSIFSNDFRIMKRMHEIDGIQYDLDSTFYPERTLSIE